jgi:hypothetical protein
MPALDDTLRMVLMGVLLPIWVAAGMGDWWCHRTQRMERTAGLGEALLHSLMLATLGTAALAVLFLEINALVLIGLLISCLLHEMLFWLDLSYATHHRQIGALEQWIHCVQFAVPWASLAIISLIHRDTVATLLGASGGVLDWSLHTKYEPLPAAFLVPALAGCGVFVVLPFLEELWRCYKARREQSKVRPSDGSTLTSTRASA